MTKIIAITGGKGGTGKSTVSTSLANTLSKKHSVLLVDADVDCPNDHLLLAIKRQNLEVVYQRIPSFNLETCLQCGKCAKVCKSSAIVAIKNQNPIFIPEQCNGCGSCEIICPNNSISWKQKIIGNIYFNKNNNLFLLTGELKSNEPVSEFVVNVLNDKIKQMKNDFDYIIIDTAAGTHCPVIAAFELADIVFSVTEPTPLGRHDLDIILQLLDNLNKENYIILNRSDIGNSKIIYDLSKKYDSQIICQIPYSKNIANSYSNAKLIEIEQLEKIQKIIK